MVCLLILVCIWCVLLMIVVVFFGVSIVVFCNLVKNLIFNVFGRSFVGIDVRLVIVRCILSRNLCLMLYMSLMMGRYFF